MYMSAEDFEEAIRELGYISDEACRYYYWSPTWQNDIPSEGVLTDFLEGRQRTSDKVPMVVLDMSSYRGDRYNYVFPTQYQSIGIDSSKVLDSYKNFAIETYTGEGYTPLIDLAARYKAKAQAMYDEMPKT
jgi:hypothetical protein